MYEFDLQKAQNYFKLAYDGGLWHTGFKISILYNTGNEPRTIAAEDFRDNLNKINPRFQIEVRGGTMGNIS